MSAKQIAGTIIATVIGGVITYAITRRMEANAGGGMPSIQERKSYYA